MSASTGPVVAIGAITLADIYLLTDGPKDINRGVKVVVGTTVLATMLAGVDSISSDVGKSLAYLALVSSLLVGIGIDGKKKPSVVNKVTKLLGR